ncbi:MAG: DUF6790 family protein [Elusimicrobiales bacterium]
MTAAMFCSILEAARWGCVGTGFYLAFMPGMTPQMQLHVLMPWLVLPLAGLTGIESVFLGSAAAKSSGYGANPAYQRQSGFNNIAVAATAFAVWLFNWGTRAEAAVLTVLLIFLALSACNHFWTAIRENNRSVKNLLRPLLTLLLLAFSVPFLARALR